MQIVIKINKNLYKYIKCLEQHKNDMLDILIRAVQNGTPLPKHHGDLKDVDKIKEEAIDMSQWGSDTAYGVWVEDIDAAPTIIPATKGESK